MQRADLAGSAAAVLKAASAGDWASYEKVCDKDITCFEPEAMGCVAEGLAFHKFYFTLPKAADAGPKVPPNTTLVDVNIRMLGDAGASHAIALSRSSWSRQFGGTRLVFALKLTDLYRTPSQST